MKRKNIGCISGAYLFDSVRGGGERVAEKYIIFNIYIIFKIYCNIFYIYIAILPYYLNNILVCMYWERGAILFEK